MSMHRNLAVIVTVIVSVVGAKVLMALSMGV